MLPFIIGLSLFTGATCSGITVMYMGKEEISTIILFGILSTINFTEAISTLKNYLKKED
jgi:hypothetical protein